MSKTTTPDLAAKIESAIAWTEGEVTRRSNASARATTLQGVVGHQAASNHLRTFLDAYAEQREELAEQDAIQATYESERDKASATIAALTAEVERLKLGIRQAQEALVTDERNGDVVWFSMIETMFEHLDTVRDPDQADPVVDDFGQLLTTQGEG